MNCVTLERPYFIDQAPQTLERELVGLRTIMHEVQHPQEPRPLDILSEITNDGEPAHIKGGVGVSGICLIRLFLRFLCAYLSFLILRERAPGARVPLSRGSGCRLRQSPSPFKNGGRPPKWGPQKAGIRVRRGVYFALSSRSPFPGLPSAPPTPLSRLHSSPSETCLCSSVVSGGKLIGGGGYHAHNTTSQFLLDLDPSHLQRRPAS